MRTAIIDRSLCGVTFKEVIGKTDVYMYAQSLIEAGADYIEIDLQALVRLPEPSGAENYIFRLENADEYRIANALPFSYALLPLRLSHLIDRLQVPVILEIKTGDADILALLKVVSESIDLTNVALLRLIGDFRKSPEEFKTILNKLKMLYAVPLDICPLNTTLGALTAAIAAHEAGADSVTFSFGNNSNFTSFEEFLISMATVHKNIISRSYISGICKAAVISSFIGDIETQNLKMLMKRYRLSPQRVEVADGSPIGFNPWRGIKHRRKSFMERRLIGMEVEGELSEEIIDKLKKCGIEFYSGGKKDDCLN
ncbi:MAG: hypothetical protein LBC82_04210 [Oscillospiraceae bacterium]|jgi:hypothetical protein|nr:hypothetical protein [Oscillospiraceae bacterium]